jgi:hypothetical protein
MTGPTAGPPDRDRNSEPYLGDADAVEKTTYVQGSGTSPERSADGPGATGGTSFSLWGWVAIAVAILAGLMYGLPLIGAR